MACRLFGDKPVSKPMLGYRQLGPNEQTSVIFNPNTKLSIHKKCIWKYRLRNGSHLVQEEMSSTSRACDWNPFRWKTGRCGSNFYASAFRRRRHYVFGLSVRPSVRPKPEIPSFDLYMGPLVHPTNRNHFTACPSVRPSVCPSVRRGFRAFAGECMEGLAWNFTCWCILTTFRTD